MAKKWSQRDWSGLGWAAGFFACTLLMVMSHSQLLGRFQKVARTSREVEAVVTSAMPGWRSRDDGEPPSITFSFEVNGRSYEGNGEMYVPEGESVMIRYSPSNPSESWVVGDELNWSSLSILPILSLLASGVCFMTSFSEKTLRMMNPEGPARYEITPALRFPVVLLALVSAYLSFFEPLKGGGAEAPQVFAWATACFLLYPAIRWKAWLALVPLIPLVATFNPIAAVGLGSNPAGWISGTAGFAFAILAAKLKPSQESS